MLRDIVSFPWVRQPTRRLFALLAAVAILAGSGALPRMPPAQASPSARSVTWAWGTNGDGQLGDGTTADRIMPVVVEGLPGVTAVAAGDSHSLALRNDGAVWAWGDNAWGQLGDGSTTDRSSPVRVDGLTDVTAIAAGHMHSLALREDGSVWAWGQNSFGQLGDGTSQGRTSPVRVQDLTGVTAIAGGGQHSLAVREDGTVWAWGRNEAGQLGYVTSGQQRSTVPGQATGLENVNDVGAGWIHSLALLEDGTVRGWGSNHSAQLGECLPELPLTPCRARVGELTGITAIAAGSFHSLALDDAGTVYAWGRNDHGQLGDGTTEDTDRTSPVTLNGLTAVRAIAAGGRHSLAVDANGTAWAWGRNDDGRLGDGSTSGRTTPGAVQGLMGAVAVAAGGGAGGGHSLALQVPPPEADLAVTLTALPKTVRSGEQLTYTVTVSNQGPDAAEVVVASLNLAEAVEFVHADDRCSDPDPETAGGTVSCVLGTLAADDTTSLDVAVRVIGAPKESVTSVAVVGSATSDPDATNNTASVTTKVRPAGKK